MAALALNVETDIIRETEIKLERWGRWSRDTAERLGYPQSTSIARLIEMVKVFEQKRKGVRRLSVARKADEAEEAPALPGETAKGKQTLSMRPPVIGEVPSDIMIVDAAVASLPGWMQARIIRSYKFGQPDRRACQDMRMRQATYREQREAAVLQVAENLANRSGRR